MIRLIAVCILIFSVPACSLHVPQYGTYTSPGGLIRTNIRPASQRPAPPPQPPAADIERARTIAASQRREVGGLPAQSSPLTVTYAWLAAVRGFDCDAMRALACPAGRLAFETSNLISRACSDNQGAYSTLMSLGRAALDESAMYLEFQPAETGAGYVRYRGYRGTRQDWGSSQFNYRPISGEGAPVRRIGANWYVC